VPVGTELETTINAIRRICHGEGIYIDVDAFQKTLEVFNYISNNLLLKFEYLTYDD